MARSVLHTRREHPARNEAVLHPFHGDVLFSADWWSFVQFLYDYVLEVLQIRAGGVFQFRDGFHTGSAHGHDDARDETTIRLFITHTRSSLASRCRQLSIPHQNDQKFTFLPFAGGGKYSCPSTRIDIFEKSLVGTLFDMMPVR
jgi:hypothetical protein